MKTQENEETNAESPLKDEKFAITDADIGMKEDQEMTAATTATGDATADATVDGDDKST